MKTLYLDLNNGVAGDMLSAALLSLFENKEEVLKQLNDFNIPHTRYELNKVVSHNEEGYHMSVLIHNHEEGEEDHHHEHHHHHGHHLHEVKHIVSHFSVSDEVKNNIYSIYDDIAAAEAKVHETTVDEIHFHEVGNLDAIADISAVTYLINKLNVDNIIATDICVGSGKVNCAHGLLDVPAPATLELLNGLPYYKSEKVNSELATPTGVALVKHFVKEFKSLDELGNKIGVGIGSKDFGIFTGIKAYLIED